MIEKFEDINSEKYPGWNFDPAKVNAKAPMQLSSSRFVSLDAWVPALLNCQTFPTMPLWEPLKKDFVILEQVKLNVVSSTEPKFFCQLLKFYLTFFLVV